MLQCMQLSGIKINLLILVIFTLRFIKCHVDLGNIIPASSLFKYRLYSFMDVP